MKDFDKIIMNPPYDRSLHLKILRQVMNKANEVVNLSPIRWLSDELAEYKKVSEYNKFADIRNRISNLEVIKSVDAENAFGIALPFDLGIYYITPTITNYSFSKNRIVNKMMNKEGITIGLPTTLYSNRRKRHFFPIRIIGAGHNSNKEANMKIATKGIFEDGLQNGKDWKEVKGNTVGSYLNTNIIESDNLTELNNIYGYLNSKLIKYFLMITTTGSHIQYNYVPYLPDYTHSWTDEMLYEYFGLTDSEIQEIEQVV